MDSTGQGQKRWVIVAEIVLHLSSSLKSPVSFQYLVIDLCVTDVTDVCKRLAGLHSAGVSSLRSVMMTV